MPTSSNCRRRRGSNSNSSSSSSHLDAALAEVRMGNRLHRLARDERGFSLVYICVGFMAFLTATTLAIDVGMFMTARSQSQNSADAGALAGATALAFDSFTDHTAAGPAVSSALDTARANKVISQIPSVGPA